MENDGGPAFPNSSLATRGLSLRDYIATEAMKAEVSRICSSPDKVAEFAYALADAMLAARQPKGE